uniref:Putative heat shock protein n=1 Tax=Nyssomyia neivai TaxID=330878 RepID=A0A1L8DUC5_9DIPT
MLNIVMRRCGGCTHVIRGTLGAAVRSVSTSSQRNMGIFPRAHQSVLLPTGSCSSVGIRKFSSESMKIATYEEVKQLCDHPEKLLIDVREPNELLETGSIPTSINIPLNSVEESLKMSNEDFKAKYGRDKPSKEQEVIFHCRLGGRAGKAHDIAVALGFANAKNYKGSWAEWSEKEGLPQK